LDLRFTVNVDSGLLSKFEYGDPARLSSFVSSMSGLEVWETVPKVSEAAGLVVSGATAAAAAACTTALVFCSRVTSAPEDSLETLTFELGLDADIPTPIAAKPEQRLVAHVGLRDGRMLVGQPTFTVLHFCLLRLKQLLDLSVSF
jgi:hypothetical protein